MLCVSKILDGGCTSSTSLQGRVAIITGAASEDWFGKSRINGERLADTVKAFQSRGGDLIHCCLDVALALAQSSSEMVEQTLTASDQLDMAHLNAGILVNKPILESSLETWQRVIDVSLNGMFLGIRSCAPHIVTHVKGSIVVTASVSGILSNKSMPFYTTSKHGVVGLLKAASAELGASGIRINAVCPSPTYTGMMMEGGASIDQINQCEIAKMTVLGRVGKARKIGDMVCFLGSDAASYMTGGVHLIDGGMTAVGRKPI